MTGKTRLVFGLAALVLVSTILGLFGLGAADHDRPSVIGLPPTFPAFTMIREETTGGVTRTYEFVYQDDLTWKLTLVKHDGDPRSLIGPGYTVEHRDGKMIWTVAGETHSEDAPTDGLHSPGHWLKSPATFKGWASARGAKIEVAQRSATEELTNHFTMIDGGGYRQTVQFHAKTGIPMHHRLYNGTQLVEEHKVVSLVLADGTRLK